MKVKETKLILKAVLLLSIMLISACQEEKDDLHAYVAKIKMQPKQGIEPLPVVKEQERFTYTANDLRDPFKAVVIRGVRKNDNEEVLDDNGLRPDENRIKEVLEGFPLEELQLVGTLGKDVIWALIRTPEDIIYHVQVGNYIGLNNGKILDISESQLELRELVLDGSGRYLERDNTLSIVEES